MIKQTLPIQERMKTGKGACHKYRKQGMVPGVIYGEHGNKNILVNANEFDKMLHHINPNTIITLVDEKKSKTDSFVKDYQENLVSRQLIHVDFIEITKGKIVRVHVPIKEIGNCVGVKEGGIMEFFLHSLDIECLPKDMPESIEIDVTNLKIHDSIHVKDLKLKEGIRIHQNPEQVIVVVGAPKTQTAAESEAAETEDEEAAGEGDKKSE